MFEAAQDALDDFHTTTAAGAAEPLARQGSRSGRWGILSRKSSQPAGEAAAGGGAAGGQSQLEQQQEQQRELEFFRGECLRQGQELQGLRDELQGAAAAARQARQALNLQTFKFELLIDLVRGCNAAGCCSCHRCMVACRPPHLPCSAAMHVCGFAHRPATSVL